MIAAAFGMVLYGAIMLWLGQGSRVLWAFFRSVPPLFGMLANIAVNLGEPFLADFNLICINQISAGVLAFLLGRHLPILKSNRNIHQ